MKRYRPQPPAPLAPAPLMPAPLASLALLALLALPPLTGCTRAAAEPAASTSGTAAGTGAALRGPEDFAGIEDAAARSAALFAEAGEVLTHPRCVNCHPAGDRPLQGESGEAHQPWVRRDSDGHGAVGMRCAACHHQANFDPGRVPGAPHWHLAPVEMAWEGLSAAEICAQLKDRSRNGDRSLEEIVVHMRSDPLVSWGWDPGAGREPAPGSQAVFADLIAAWVETGAICPGEPAADPNPATR